MYVKYKTQKNIAARCLSVLVQYLQVLISTEIYRAPPVDVAELIAEVRACQIVGRQWLGGGRVLFPEKLSKMGHTFKYEELPFAIVFVWKTLFCKSLCICHFHKYKSLW